MFNLNIEIILLLLSCFLCFAVSLRLFSIKSKNKKTDETLTSTQNSLNSLQAQLENLKNQNKENNSFDSTLHTVKVTTNLQKSRTQYHQKAVSTMPPERYRYIRSLLDNGLDSEKIASVLAISIQEAEQLVALSKLAQRREGSLTEN
jgi:hypothetical protein